MTRSITSRADVENLAVESSEALVIASFLPPEGETGVHTHVRQLRGYLDVHGPRTTLVTSHSWGRGLRVPVFGPGLLLKPFCRPAEVLWWRHFNEVFVRNALRRHLAEEGNCVIYAQDPLSARAALRVRQGPNQPVVLALHGMSHADDCVTARLIKHGGIAYRAIRRIEREVIPQVDGLVFVSRWTQHSLLRWLPEARTVPSAVIGNFVTSLRLEAAPEPLGDLVTAGRLEPVKNHRFLVEVLSAAKESGRSFTLDIFGDGSLRKDLLQYARSLGVAEQIRFRGFQSDLRRLLPSYRAYVHAASAEAFPLAIIEAMAAGLPVIAGDAGGISELCDDGTEARFWPLDDPARAAAILTGLLDDEPARLRTAHAARGRFERDFDASVIGPRLRSFLLGMSADTTPVATEHLAIPGEASL